MPRFDRYMLRQLLVAFGFFALVMVGVFWVTRSVTLFDRLIRGGQSVTVFLEFTALTLPTLIRTVAPIAAFIATLYTVNRMSRESELTVMTATGASPWRLARPVLWFGVVVAVLMSTLTWFLRPLSVERLEIREAEVAQDITAQLLSPGTFLHPLKGVTFFIRDIDDDGTLRDIFISDRRAPDAAYTFTAREAYIVRTEAGVSLVMVDGMSLQLDGASNQLGTTRFSDFTYDITPMVQRASAGGRSIRAVPTIELIFGSAQLELDRFGAGQIAAELHERISLPLICIAVSLVAYATLMLGSFSRFGLWPQVLVAFGLLIVLEFLRSYALPIISSTPGFWPLAYMPFCVALMITALFLRLSGRPLRPVSGGASEAQG